MRRVKLTSSMKTDEPHVIIGDKGDVLSLPDHVAHFVVTQNNGVYQDSEPGPSRAELERHEDELTAALTSGADEVPADLKPEDIQRPYSNAPKSAWVRYACQVDDALTEERAEDMTKADLISRYGERL